MTQDEKIISMARESGIGDTGVQCGFVFFQSGAEGLKRFATLVRAESAKEDLEVLENLRKETIAQCEAGMIEAYQLGRAEALKEAAKVCRTAQAQGIQSIREAIEKAIRGLKESS